MGVRYLLYSAGQFSPPQLLVFYLNIFKLLQVVQIDLRMALVVLLLTIDGHARRKKIVFKLDDPKIHIAEDVPEIIRISLLDY